MVFLRCFVTIDVSAAVVLGNRPVGDELKDDDVSIGEGDVDEALSKSSKRSSLDGEMDENCCTS